jgi:ribosomal protein S18 acetylase RimI-like enzyme
MTDVGVLAQVERLTSREARALRAGFVELLRDAVAGGASVGFLDPLSDDQAAAYWDGVFAEVDAGDRLLLAIRDGDEVLGSVQLAIPAKPNARHRVAVEKLLVHSTARRRGLGTALMRAAEDAAIGLGRHLLVLDTEAGDRAGRLYERLGYVRAGVIPGYALSPAGRPLGAAFYYRNLRDNDAHMLGESDAPPRDFG